MASAGEATDKIFWYLIDPPSTPDFSGKVGLPKAWLLPIAVMLGTCMMLAGENL